MKFQIIAGWLGVFAGAGAVSQGLPSRSQTPMPQMPTASRDIAAEAVAQLEEGFVRRSQGDNASALTAFNQAIQIAPNYAEAYAAKGSLLYKQGQSIAAIDHYNQAIRLNPTLVAALMGKGQAMARQGKRAEARVLFKTAQSNFRAQGDLQRAAIIEHLLPGL